MTKEVFLSGLREALQNEIGDSAIEVNIAYYKEYIENHVEQGEQEEEVIAELGEPRLIAKTIIDTTLPETYYSNDAEGEEYGAEGEEYGAEDNPWAKAAVPWYKRIFSWVLILFILFIVLRVLGVIAGLFFRIGIPILFIIWIIHMVKHR